MIHEAIILAGGLGTRLRPAVPNLPKCMAPVGGKPFLHYIIRYYSKQGISRFIFSLGYKHEVIEEFLRTEFNAIADANYTCVVEDEPLGTGGAVMRSAAMVNSYHAIVLNGDTFFAVDLPGLSALYEEKTADCVLSLKPMTDMERYGAVDRDNDQRIISFREKQFYREGLINGGVYALNTRSFLQEKLPPKFSFEKDYLEAFFTQRQFYASVQDGYFIDIGIPEDFTRANIDFHNFSV